MQSTAKASIVVALVFIVGFLSGIGAIATFQAFHTVRADDTRTFLPRRANRYAGDPAPRIERLARELNLTPAQREQFIPVLHTGVEKIRALRRKHQPEVRDVLLETRAALRSILDEKQCRRFDELSLILGPDPDFRGFGRCLQDSSGLEHRGRSGRDRSPQPGSRKRHRYQ